VHDPPSPVDPHHIEVVDITHILAFEPQLDRRDILGYVDRVELGLPHQRRVDLVRTIPGGVPVPIDDAQLAVLVEQEKAPLRMEDLLVQQ